MEAEITHDIAHKLWVQASGNVAIPDELNPAVTLNVSRHLGFSGDADDSATIDDTTRDLLKQCSATHTHGTEILDHLLRHLAKMQVSSGVLSKVHFCFKTYFE